MLRTVDLEFIGRSAADHQARRYRLENARRKAGGDFRVAITRNDYDLTLAAVTRALEEEPGLKLVYMANLSVPACVVAIRRAGKEGQVRVLAHDGGPEIRAFLQTGQVDFSIDQNLTYQSYQALSVLFQAVLEHKLPEREFYYPASPILNAETV